MEAQALETFLTLVLENVDPELSRAHRELYPERIPEHIPFSLTLHYPWAPKSPTPIWRQSDASSPVIRGSSSSSRM